MLTLSEVEVPVRAQSIDLRDAVTAERAAALGRLEEAAVGLGTWAAGPGSRLPLHRFEADLFGRLMSLGCLLVALWWSHRMPTVTPAVLRRSGGHYSYRGRSHDEVRTRFGVLRLGRPVYERVSGRGPALVSPADRLMGLAAGRMSLGVHLMTAWLVAQTTFDDAVEVLGRLCGYAPSKRSSLGIADALGPEAAEYLDNLPAPEGDGEILVIQLDDKAAPMLKGSEHSKRCRPHKKLGRGTSRREARRIRRRTERKVRRKKGDKSKNGRSAKMAVVYTLCRLPDGRLEGPVNRRVLGTFASRSKLVRG